MQMDCGRKVARLAALGLLGAPLCVAQKAVAPATMQKIGTVSERFQSYNIEMQEVTGGRFWAPYDAPKQAASQTKAAAPGQLDSSLYAYRPPDDLSRTKLRKLAAALGPAYVRVSGTWANSTYFQDDDKPALKTPPAGFGGVLTRAQWKGVIDFAKAANAEIVTSFAVSAGARDANGVWTPMEAKKVLSYTWKAGGSIAAAEMFNEPTIAALGGTPKGYNAQDYGKDFRVYLAFVKEAAPKMLVLGPSGVGDDGLLPPSMASMMLSTASLLQAEGPGLQRFTYHFYGTVSQRCATAMGAQMGIATGTTPAAALTPEWLTKTDGDEKFYAGLRDMYSPGTPLWLSETGQAACGGDRWASDFIDSFRYLNQLGTLAQRGVQVVMHNTLDASDYSLLNETTLTPKPNYYAALLWRRLMGTTVLEPGASPTENLYIYAHCLRGHPGGVALLAINADRAAAHELSVPMRSERYTLTAKTLLSPTVDLNGTELQLGADDSLPKLAGVATTAGTVTFAPESITFLAMSKAGNAACK